MSNRELQQYMIQKDKIRIKISKQERDRRELQHFEREQW